MQDSLSKRRQALKRGVYWAKLGFTPLALGFLAYYAATRWSVLSRVLASADIRIIAVSVLLWFLVHLVAVWAGCRFVAACGGRVGYPGMLSIYARRLPARYLPGGIWHTVGKAADLSALGLSGGQVAGFVLMETGVMVGVASLLGGGLLAFFRGVSGWGGVGLAAAVAGGGGLVLLPWAVGRRISVRKKAYALSLLAMIVFWALGSAAFVTYISSFPAWSGGHAWLEIAGAYMFSWAAGFVTVFAPQGIGIFESVVGELIPSSLGFGDVVVLAAGFRAVALVADLLAWALFGIGRRRLDEHSLARGQGED